MTKQTRLTLRSIDTSLAAIDRFLGIEPIVPQAAFNVSTRKIGGIRFVKLGRFCFSFCVTKTYKPL